MRRFAVVFWLAASAVAASALAACSTLPAEAPTASALRAAAKAGGRLRFDLVTIDPRVVRILRERKRVRFAAFFKPQSAPPKLEIAVGDTLAVTLWGMGADGLSASVTNGPGERGRRSPSGDLGRTGEGPAAVPGGPFLARSSRQGLRRSVRGSAKKAGGAGGGAGSRAIVIPDEVVGRDGAISIPFAGRIRAAGRVPAELERAIERRLQGKAVAPRAIVIDRKSPANSVTVTGVVIAGARVRLSPAGERLLQVIAAAGGARSPLYDTLLSLSRGGVTAKIPVAELVAHPKEDIYAEPGDVLTLSRMPRGLSVAGAVGKKAVLPFGSAQPTLIEALGKAHGLAEDRARPEGVFLFRFERDRVVRALGEPVIDTVEEGFTPVAYRLDLRDPQSYGLARRFPLRNRDLILVTEAETHFLAKLSRLVEGLVNPFANGILVCRNSNC